MRWVKRLASFIVLCAMALVLCACDGESPAPLHLVFVVDLSGSIPSQSEHHAFHAIGDSLRTLHRHDAAAVIPVTGDAEIEDEGRILRYTLKVDREPFDQDLRRMADGEEKALKRLLASTLKRPYPSTDIIGALTLAAEEFSYDPPDSIRVIIVLSDFLQDDRQYRFNRDGRLRNERAAKVFAASLARRGGHRLAGIHVYLGALSSTDLRDLSRERRQAVRAFWNAYLAAQGARVSWATDGPGRLPLFLRQLSKIQRAKSPTPLP